MTSGKDNKGMDAVRKPTRRHSLRMAFALCLLLLIGLFVWQWPDLRAKSELGSAFAARVGCACRYVEGRPLESCQRDMEAAAWMVSMADDPQEKRVTGSVPLIARRSATYRGASGCVMDKE